MHLIEQYSLGCGVKIDKPSVEVSFFPLPFDKYIVIHPSSGMEPKTYDYFNDVINLIYPLLSKNNISIVQIGDKKDTPLPKCHHLNGVTTLSQSFYLIKNCELLIGNDSFSTHVASGFDKKLVSLYSTNFKECCGTYWGSPENQFLIQADLNGNKPSFSDKESPKVVNNIMPEEIGVPSLDLLNIKHKLKSYKTLNIGEFYSSPSLEVIPDFFTPLNVPPKTGINLRLDYHFDLNFTASWLSKHPTHIITNQNLPIELLGKFKNNISKISIDLESGGNFSHSDIKKINSIGVPIEIFSSDLSMLNSHQVQFIEWGVRKLSFPEKKDLDFSNEVCNNSFYYSSKTILSKNKEYSSKAGWLNSQEKSKIEKVIDSPEFWKESDYFRIYNKK